MPVHTRAGGRPGSARSTRAVQAMLSHTETEVLMEEVRNLDLDVMGVVAEFVMALRRRQYLAVVCGDELRKLWRKKVACNNTGIEFTITDYINDGARFGAYDHIHPGRHFLPCGIMRRQSQLCTLGVARVLRIHHGNLKTNVFLGGHELLDVLRYDDSHAGLVLWRGAEGRRRIIRDDPIISVMREMGMSEIEIWECEFSSHADRKMHQQKIFDFLMRKGEYNHPVFEQKKYPGKSEKSTQ